MLCPGDPIGKKSYPRMSYWACRQTLGRLKADLTYHDADSGNPAYESMQGVQARARRPLSKVLLVTDFFHPSLRADGPTAGFTEINYPYTEPTRIPLGQYDINANHKTGANHLFWDGHVEFINYRMYSNYNTKFWNSMSTSF